MKRIKKIWDSISNIGILDRLNTSDKKRILLLNQMTFISVIFSVAFSFIFSIWNFKNTIPFQFVFLFLYSSVLFASSRRAFHFSKVLFIITLYSHVFILCLLFGETSQVHLLYIPVAVIPIILYDLKQFRISFSFLILLIASLVLLYLIHFSWFFSITVFPELLEKIRLLFIVTSIVAEIVVVYSLIANYDKTERNLDENNILLQQQLQAIFDNSFDALFLINWKERKIIKANNRAVELFEAEKESDFYGLYGLEFHKSPKEKTNYEEMRKSLKEKGVFEEEILYKTFKGNEFWGALVIQIIYISGMPYQSIRITDSTQQKNAKKQIQDSLHEKEILLSEIHHRVKNNLAVISGLLGLQSSYVEDEKAKVLFEDSRNRIHSMALIHDKLYQHETFAQIEFRTYINDLINHIKSSYFSKQAKVNFTVTCNDIFLDIKTAIPCGLILNELITNACKHAFKGRTEGVINIVCSKMGGNFTLMVSDNGVGFNGEEALKKPNSLGLTLINALSEQINGKIKTTYHSGTAYYISIEI